MRTKALLLAATVLLGGCYGFRGPEPVLDRYGVVRRDEERARFGDLFERFRLATLRATHCQRPGPSDPAAAGMQCPSGPGAERDAILHDYMRAGFLLVNADCAHFFAHMARNQGRSRIFRDSIGPIATLITGIVALSGTTAGGIPELTLATAAAGSSLDIFDQRFLFGSDNIDAVRTLVRRSQNTHADTALAVSDLNFEQASNEILAYQEICTPSRILTMTRQSIQNAMPAPDSPASGTKPGTGATPPGQTMSTTSVSVPEQPR